MISKKTTKESQQGALETGFRGGEGFGISEPTWNGEGLSD